MGIGQGDFESNVHFARPVMDDASSSDCSCWDFLVYSTQYLKKIYNPKGASAHGILAFRQDEWRGVRLLCVSSV